MKILEAIERGRVLVGVVHLGALPGAPGYAGGLEEVLQRANADARALAEGGCDAAIVENFGDAPFFPDAVPAETVAAMARCVLAVREAVPGLELGVNVLRNDARAALGLCAATGAGFLRVNVHVGAAVTDQGIVQGRAAETVRERGRLCPGARILADVHVKHASQLGAQSPGEAARDTLGRGRADALIVTGSATGRPPDPELVAEVREAVGPAPLLVGSGVTEETAPLLLSRANGAIVGTWLKRGARVEEPVDVERVVRLRRVLDSLA